MSESDKTKIKNMNLFEGYQCCRYPDFFYFKDHECYSGLGIKIDNCLVCSNWKQDQNEFDEDDDE